MPYEANSKRYEMMKYRRCGNSGLLLPMISLGLWHNFGDVDNQDTAKDLIFKAFDLGITHFDLANNYGPPPGSAETNFGKILHQYLGQYRDEMIISSKAGYRMWPGPYGDCGSRKYLMASLDQSLKRMNLDYVDIFYSHRFDAKTPLEETMTALADIVKQGKALYIGLSSYPVKELNKASKLLDGLGVPMLIHQPCYNMMQRDCEKDLFPLLDSLGKGIIAFCPLAQGLLTNKYIKGIPDQSRASKDHGFLKAESITPIVMAKMKQLNEIAAERGQSLAQLALCWVLRHSQMTSALIGASKVSQLEDCVGALSSLELTDDELNKIEEVLS